MPLSTPFAMTTRRKAYGTSAGKTRHESKVERVLGNLGVKFRKVMGPAWERIPPEMVALAQQDWDTPLPYAEGDELVTVGDVVMAYEEDVEVVESKGREKPVQGVCAWPFCGKKLGLIRASDSDGHKTCLRHGAAVLIMSKSFPDERID